MKYSGYCIRPVNPGGPDQCFEVHPPHRPRKILATTQTVREAIEQIDEWKKQIPLFQDYVKYGQ